MHTDTDTVRRPRPCVVNNRMTTSGTAIAYVGLAFGPSSLAASLGTICGEKSDFTAAHDEPKEGADASERL